MYAVREDPPEEAREVLGEYDALTRKLLYARGIVSAGDAGAFFGREWVAPDPYVYGAMEKAAKRLVAAVGAKERVGVYSDYDCDGIPAAAVFCSMLRAFGHRDIEYYVPNRNEQGFGLNDAGVRAMIDAGVSVLCVFDCGTSDPARVAALSDAGITVIVVDHHLPGETRPEPFAMINPMLEDGVPEPYPCAAGLSFLLVQAVIDQAHRGAGTVGGSAGTDSTDGTDAVAPRILPQRGWEKWQLDLVALATLSDMVPLHGLNRQFVHYGLEVLRKSPRPGVQALCRLLKIEQRDISQDDLSFSVIPRINAASRMGEASLAFRLLTTGDVSEAMTLAADLTALNDKRKTTVASMVRQANRQAKSKDAGRGVWVFGSREWKPSLVGLVAQKLGETHDKTVFVWGQGGADGAPSIKGSCRSVRHNAFSMMEEVSDLFLESGGHRQAGGFTLAPGAELVLEERLNGTVAAAEEHAAERCVDCECSVEDIAKVFALGKRFAPFGTGNEPISIAVPRAVVKKKISFGKGNDHLRYVFSDGTDSIEGVVFFGGQDERHSAVAEGQTLRAVIGQAEWDGYRNRPRLRILDVLC